MSDFCISCGMPINQESKNITNDNYCKYCADENGQLYPKEVVQKGIAEWLKNFSPNYESVDIMQKAEYYLKSMPAWWE